LLPPLVLLKAALDHEVDGALVSEENRVRLLAAWVRGGI